jgi:hypothetical protein
MEVNVMILKFRNKFLPEVLILKTLLEEQVKVEVPTLGGIDSVLENILHFSLKSDEPAIVSLYFNYRTSSFVDISFEFYGMEKVKPERYFKEFFEREEKDELSILEQALVILKGKREFNKYEKAIREYYDLLITEKFPSM